MFFIELTHYRGSPKVLINVDHIAYMFHDEDFYIEDEHIHRTKNADQYA